MSNQQPEPTRSFGDPFAQLFSEIRRGQQATFGQQTFYATVSAYVGGPPKTATVTRLGATIAEGPYRVANHIATLAVGARVLVQDTTGEGGFVVMAEVPV